MFERSKIDNVPEPSAVPVEVTLLDGSVLKGKVLVPMGKVLSDALNSSGPFLEFEPYGGDRRFVAKAQIAALKLVGIPKAGTLNVRGADAFDPHAILGIPATASWDEVRQSYHKLAKLYHPDRYASASLPDEVRRVPRQHGPPRQCRLRRPRHAPGREESPGRPGPTLPARLYNRHARVGQALDRCRNRLGPPRPPPATNSSAPFPAPVADGWLGASRPASWRGGFSARAADYRAPRGPAPPGTARAMRTRRRGCLLRASARCCSPMFGFLRGSSSCSARRMSCSGS